MVALGARAREVDATLLTTMRDRLVHRGPDAAATWIADDRRAGLAFRRLIVVDPAPEAGQPMATADGSLHLVFNGEIYNHRALRAELDAEAPAPWRTDHSDTEVLLRAWERWGVGAIERLRGMFAFAVWDARRRELWLVRDRIGIKPLYLTRSGERVAFASEIKALLADPETPRAVDEDAYFYYLSTHHSPPAQTLFAGIAKVPAGHWLRIGADGATRLERYWEPWDHVRPLVGVADDEIADRLREAIDESVRIRSVADVPVGILLSGGIDSSTVAAFLARHQNTPVRSFSIGYRDVPADEAELEYARMAARTIGAEHAERRIDLDVVLGELDRCIFLRDEPAGHGTNVITMIVARLAHEHGVVVALTGEGGDEIFAGYPEWPRIARAQALADRLGARGMAAAASRLLALLGRSHTRRRELLRRAARGEPLFWGGSEGLTHEGKLRLLSPRLRERFRERSPWEILAPIHARFRAKAWDPSPVNWMTDLSLFDRLPEMLLQRIDRMSMGVSVEGRVPLLDHHVVTLVLGIPSALKLRNGELKPMLKRAARGLVPDPIIERPKQGMPLPPLAFLGSERVAGPAAREIDAFARQSDLLDPAAAARLWAAGGRRAWSLMEVARWWRLFFS
jgi:asparagine synthase (glutamine-hydrolysing)